MVIKHESNGSHINQSSSSSFVFDEQRIVKVIHKDINSRDAKTIATIATGSKNCASQSSVAVLQVSGLLRGQGVSSPAARESYMLFHPQQSKKS
mmetsp:Transcript_19033/g.28468  ORF Transcript_19033/g.28468 Transcript_19033/m.28468 type:complete len:94 (+) Transcript_19033:72-353(+)